MSRYPSWSAGEDITADKLLEMLPQWFYKGSDTTRNNTTTLSDDPDLVCTLEANAVYHIELWLHYHTPAAANFRTDWSYTGTYAGNKSALGLGTTVSDTTPQGIARIGVHGASTDMDYGDRAGTSDCLAYEAGLVTTTTSGTFSFRWAQVTATVGDTVLSQNSRLRVERVA